MIKTAIEKVGEYFLFLRKVFARPENAGLYWKQFILETDKLIISSILIVAVISIFIGGVLAIQTASNLENPFIDKMYVGYMVRESLILEFCSTMVALILAGKMGSNIASELGSMRITEQIDAMDMMGVNSAAFRSTQDYSRHRSQSAAYDAQLHSRAHRRVYSGGFHRNNTYRFLYRGHQIQFQRILHRLQLFQDGAFLLPDQQHIFL